ncbi:hypothetical protein K503DRAFT_858609 [Rhizopogon vinicolor AM-OR11-026]|uniref:Uncharacterized protein n=1 Tax=Rhizopogon vinicolor AM-OR11-026 TaxID=1314800 RepID=A0A1B7MS70_9AGAM|nr:hypothetical protein K503DRAFT_858609 [Rhizopogon vinicolor AM-OR11-026]
MKLGTFDMKGTLVYKQESSFDVDRNDVTLQPRVQEHDDLIVNSWDHRGVTIESVDATLDVGPDHVQTKKGLLPNHARMANPLSNRPRDLTGKYAITEDILPSIHDVSVKREIWIHMVGGTFFWYFGEKLLRGNLYRLHCDKPCSKFWERLIGRRGVVYDGDTINKWIDVEPGIIHPEAMLQGLTKYITKDDQYPVSHCGYSIYRRSMCFMCWRHLAIVKGNITRLETGVGSLAPREV